MKINQLRVFTFLCLAVFTSVISVKYLSAFPLNTIANTSNILASETSKVFFSESKPHSSNPFSDRNNPSSVEELEENEEITDKSNLQILTFADLLRTLYFTEIQNNYCISSINGSVLSTPLYIKNCVYLI